MLFDHFEKRAILKRRGGGGANQPWIKLWYRGPYKESVSFIT